MAFGGRTEISLKKTTIDVTVSNDNRARLMYYLDCVCCVLKLDDDADISRLRKYNNYRLTDDQEAQLLALCYILSPDVLINKCIFPSEDSERTNEFYELSAVSTRFLATRSIMIGGQQKRVQKIMTFKQSWLERNWINPIQVTVHWILSQSMCCFTLNATYMYMYYKQQLCNNE